MNRFATLLVLVLAIWFAGISILMVTVPDRVAAYLRNSRPWRWYLQSVFGIREQAIDSQRLRIRIQGWLGLLFSILLCVAVWHRIVGG